MHRTRILALLLSIGLVAPPAAHADKVVLKTGTTQVGIIEQDTGDLVRLRTRLGTTGISREFIAEVRRATPAENAALEAAWAAEAEAEAAERDLRRQAREADAEAERALAEQQRAKGLVPYEGEWITPGEADLRLRQRKQELAAATAAELQALRATARAAEARAGEAEVHAQGLARDLAHLGETLRERDAELARLEAELRDTVYRLTHCGDTYLHLIHSLRRELRECRQRQPQPDATP